MVAIEREGCGPSQPWSWFFEQADEAYEIIIVLCFRNFGCLRSDSPECAAFRASASK
jgi:hypothetical protein